MLAVAMVSCEDDPVTPSGNGNGNGNGNGGNDNPPTAQTDTTIMSFTLLRSLVDVDWDVACARVIAMGFTEFDPDDEEENVRAFLKGSLTGDYYACYIRCDFPDIDNLTGGAVMYEHHLNSSNQTTCLENSFALIYDEQRVLADMYRDTVACGGNIMWSDLLDNGQLDGPHETLYPHAYSLDDYIAYARALESHNTVTANWADTYLHNYSHYTATSSAVCSSHPHSNSMENVIALAKDDNLVK